MSKIHGKNGAVKVGAIAIAEIKSFSVDQTADVASTSSMKDEWETSSPGIKRWSGSLTCNFDPDIDAGQKLLRVGEVVDLVLSPDDHTTDVTGEAIITKRGLGVNQGDYVEVSFDFKGTGALTDPTSPEVV